MSITREQQRLIDRQPFDFDKLVEFCRTKKLAKHLAVELGGALLEAQDSANVADDTTFEHMFWDGTCFITDDEFHDNFWSHGIRPLSLSDVCDAYVYDDNLDATLCLGHWTGEGPVRRWIIVRYEWKDDEHSCSGWWIDR